jgi:hypothetical protein
MRMVGRLAVAADHARREMQSTSRKISKSAPSSSAARPQVARGGDRQAVPPSREALDRQARDAAA